MRLTARLAAAASALAITATIAGATNAHAEGNPPGCPRGYFCAYTGENQTGTLALKTAGNWTGGVAGIRSVFNNGAYDPEQDHVQVGWRQYGQNYSDCLHFNPGPGAYKWNLNPVVLTSVTWRGEC
ncbi:peptidase inhibitor family I36 protein [Kitasatospora sp. NPDC096147]|uniref:peptidase inhibitor family I36 protein n=1 Tax=Kitasatospora sp. NPDC096147 TaxID=3364093 RepID=UPI00380C2588